jgi:hypothetical protein
MFEEREELFVYTVAGDRTIIKQYNCNIYFNSKSFDCVNEIITFSPKNYHTRCAPERTSLRIVHQLRPGQLKP